MRRGKGFIAPSRCSGFSLFEMVVVICSIVILYMVAEERLNQLPAAAERANFMGVLEQVKTGVNFEMVTRLAAGRQTEIQLLEGANPMDFLIEPPSNYEGELELVGDTIERRNAWYFETGTGELVYVVGGSSIDNVEVMVAGVPVKLGQIRLKLTNVYDEASSSGSGTAAEVKQRWQALVLAPVREYRWERQAEQPIPLN